MKFNLKALVAAVALSATAMSANAAIDSGNSATGNVGSELVFSAYDVTTGIGYTYDLNWSKYLNDIVGVDQAATAAGNATLVANAKVASSLIGAGGVIYDSVLTGLPFGADTSNVQWSVGAFDSFGRTRLLTTKDSTDATAYTSTSNQVKSAVTLFSGYAPSSDAFIVDPAAVANYDLDAYAVTNETNGAAYAGNSGNAWNNNIKDATNVMGAESFMYLLAQTTQASSNVAAVQTQLTSITGDKIVAKTYQQGGVWRLNISAVAAVPEPESYAMFLAGLGLMGFIARRRNTTV